LTYIKICGITNLDDARCAAEAGADLLGFIFYPRSPRYIVPREAGEVIRALRAAYGTRAPRCVGVFVNAPVEGVRAAIEAAEFDLAQLHGDEPPEQVAALHPWAFKALRPRTLAEAEEALVRYRSAFLDRHDAPQLLMDAYHPARYGGTGVRAHTEIARAIAPHARLLLAGGLTPETVGEAIRTVRPWGVDVSSGVEVRPGVKDHDRVRAFAQAVREVDQT